MDKRMNESTFTFRVDKDLKNQFARAAKTHDRAGAQLLRDFMRDYVRQQKQAATYDAWFRRQVDKGRASADAGDLIPAADVEAEAETWRTQTRQRMVHESS
jgi:predicted transcriptional regulator